jgi:galactose mutarotase-like enzyme
VDITITNGVLTAIIDTQGAELKSLKDGSGVEYMWEGNPKYWGKHSPVLFPIVGTLKNNSYLYNGNIYALTRHGFARDNVFTVQEQQEDRAVFTLLANQDTRRVYPFDFELQLHYSFSGSTLTIDYMVKNNGTAAMPFSLGAHPAFALPKKFDNYSLQFEKNEELITTQLEHDLLSHHTETIPAPGGLLPLSYDLFEHDALIFKNLQSKEVTIVDGTTPMLKVNFKDFPHLGIWTKDNAPFICIEPWQGYSDDEGATGNILEKEGMIHLDSGSVYNAGLSISIIS